MITIKRIHIGSAFRVGALVSLVVAILTGLIMVVFQGLIFSAFRSLFVSYDTSSGLQITRQADLFTTFGLAAACGFFLIYIVFSAIAGGIGGVVIAFAYNLVSNWVGGLEVELDGLGKGKRTLSADSEFFE